jgi:hypothetical protein
MHMPLKNTDLRIARQFAAVTSIIYPRKIGNEL